MGPQKFPELFPRPLLSAADELTSCWGLGLTKLNSGSVVVPKQLHSATRSTWRLGQEHLEARAAIAVRRAESLGRKQLGYAHSTEHEP